MRISVIYNNGRRVKLAPKAAHKALWHGWGVIAPDDEEGEALYAAYLQDLGLDPKDQTRPEDHLPQGYEVKRRSDWLYLFDANGNQIGNADQAMSRIIARAHDHLSSGAPSPDRSKPERSVLPEGYELETSRGWYHVIDPKGEKIGSGKRTEAEAIAMAWEDVG